MAKPTVYKSSMGKFLGLGVVVLLAAGWLVSRGLPYVRHIPVEADPFGHFVLGYVPIMMGMLLGGTVAWLYLSFSGRAIAFTPQAFAYKAGKKQVLIPWKRAFYGAPSPSKRMFRSAVVSDGVKFVRFEEFFFPQFEEMCKYIQERTEDARSEDLVV